MKTWKRVAWALIGTAAIATAIAGWLSYDAYSQTQEPPEFYEQALAVPPQEVEALHAEVERSLQRLEALETVETDEAPAEVGRPPDRWEWSVSDEQANAWLAQEAPDYLAEKRAPFADPRVEFEDGVAKVAVRYRDSRFSSVLSGELRVNLDGESGRVEAEITDVRSGKLSLPLDWAKERIDRALSRVKWPIRAETIADSISAETDLPEEGFSVRDGRRLRPTEIVVEEDRLVVRGIVLPEEEPETASRMQVSTRVARGS